ncbi:MAG: IS1595 family transposase [Spirochaetaceae bacterium]|nr:IS1595 family transposase [Spirochaetaceae bacterium]
MDTSTAKKGPGKAFRRGMSLADLFRLFPDDATAEAWFAEQRWGGKPTCPQCGHDDVQTGCAHRTMPYRCRHRECRKRFSVKVGTIMESSNLDYQTWAIAIYLHTTSLKGVSSMKLHRDLGITQKSAWHLAHRIRAAYGEPGDLFEGPVEADEAYFGGKQKNKHIGDREYIGRGAVGKTIVAGVKDRETNCISAAVVESTKKRELQSFVAQRASVAADHFTDELASYKGLPNHTAVRHSIGEYVRGQAHINGMESFWAAMKRGYYGVYHRMSPKHLDRYVAEFSGRHNLRRANTIDQMRTLVRRMLGQRLRYPDLIEPNGRPSGAREMAL